MYGSKVLCVCVYRDITTRVIGRFLEAVVLFVGCKSELVAVGDDAVNYTENVGEKKDER